MDGENAVVTAAGKGEINKFASGAERKAKERQGEDFVLCSDWSITVRCSAKQKLQC